MKQAFVSFVSYSLVRHSPNEFLIFTINADPRHAHEQIKFFLNPTLR